MTTPCSFLLCSTQFHQTLVHCPPLSLYFPLGALEAVCAVSSTLTALKPVRCWWVAGPIDCDHGTCPASPCGIAVVCIKQLSIINADTATGQQNTTYPQSMVAGTEPRVQPVVSRRFRRHCAQVVLCCCRQSWDYCMYACLANALPALGSASLIKRLRRDYDRQQLHATALPVEWFQRVHVFDHAFISQYLLEELSIILIDAVVTGIAFHNCRSKSSKT